LRVVKQIADSDQASWMPYPHKTQESRKFSPLPAPIYPAGDWRLATGNSLTAPILYLDGSEITEW